jgi:predicted DNA-binding transcriptional regulator AlpA
MEQAKIPYPRDARGWCDSRGAATYLGLSTSQIHKMRHFGTGPEYSKIGASVRYSYAAIDTWMAANARTVTRDDSAAA